MAILRWRAMIGTGSRGGRKTMADDNELTAWQRLSGKGIYRAKSAFFLLLPFRAIQLSPRRLRRRVGLKPSDSVLEIGGGPGYFRPAVAQYLARGKLVLFDYQSEMLDIAERRLKRRGLSNTERHQGDAKALPFADDRFDAGFLVTVRGEGGDPARALAEAARVLKPGGRLSVSELAGDSDYVGFEALGHMDERQSM